MNHQKISHDFQYYTKLKRNRSKFADLVVILLSTSHQHCEDQWLICNKSLTDTSACQYILTHMTVVLTNYTNKTPPIHISAIFAQSR